MFRKFLSLFLICIICFFSFCSGYFQAQAVAITFSAFLLYFAASASAFILASYSLSLLDDFNVSADAAYDYFVELQRKYYKPYFDRSMAVVNIAYQLLSSEIKSRLQSLYDIYIAGLLPEKVVLSPKAVTDFGLDTLATAVLSETPITSTVMNETIWADYPIETIPDLFDYSVCTDSFFDVSVENQPFVVSNEYASTVALDDMDRFVRKSSNSYVADEYRYVSHFKFVGGSSRSALDLHLGDFFVFSSLPTFSSDIPSNAPVDPDTYSVINPSKYAIPYSPKVLSYYEDYFYEMGVIVLDFGSSFTRWYDDADVNHSILWSKYGTLFKSFYFDRLLNLDPPYDFNVNYSPLIMCEPSVLLSLGAFYTACELVSCYYLDGDIPFPVILQKPSDIVIDDVLGTPVAVSFPAPDVIADFDIYNPPYIQAQYEAITATGAGTNVLDVPDIITETGSVDFPVTDFADAIIGSGNLNFNALKLGLGQLTTVFPFCIPWDLYNSINYFVAEPVAPRFVLDFSGTKFSSVEPIVIDFSKYSSLVKIIRFFVYFGFLMALIVITRNIIRG